MKIKRFLEQEDTMEISADKINDIIEQLTSIISDINKNKEIVETISNELSGYRSTSKKANDQIDDTVANIEQIRAKISDVKTIMDSAIKNLKDYNQNGRKFLY